MGYNLKLRKYCNFETKKFSTCVARHSRRKRLTSVLDGGHKERRERKKIDIYTGLFITLGNFKRVIQDLE